MPVILKSQPSSPRLFSSLLRWFLPLAIVLAVLLCSVLLSLLSGCHKPPHHPRLIRSLSMEDMEWMSSSGVPVMDGFIYGHSGSHETAVNFLKRQYDCYRYFNVFHVQPEAVRRQWISPWFEFVADSLMGSWGAFIISYGDTAKYAFYPEDYIINWSKIDSLRAECIVDVMIESSPGCGLFWDVVFPELASWQFTKPLVYYQMTAAQKSAWSEGLLRALHVARGRVDSPVMDPGANANRSLGVVANGNWKSLPPPVYIEGAEQSYWGGWNEALSTWQQHPSNILSVRAVAANHAWVDSAIHHWLGTDRLLAFTHEDRYRAYALADSLRRTDGSH